MKNRIKTILLVVLLIIIGITLFISFGLFGMGIEDKYGELQKVYYKSKNGDLIVNTKSRKIGEIHKTWKEISVITKEKDTFDLWYWENKINKQSSKIYRPKNKIEIQKLSYSKIETLIKNNKLNFIIDCKVKPNVITEQVQSNFNIKTDYTEFQTKMTDLDTITVWIAINTCFPPMTAEKLTISKKKGMIKIIPEFNSDIQKSKEYIKQTTILIPENDTIWKFDKFLKKNEFRLEKSDPNQITGALQITCNSKRIHFYTNKLSDYNRLLKDYFESMRNIKPETTYYFPKQDYKTNEKENNTNEK